MKSPIKAPRPPLLEELGLLTLKEVTTLTGWSRSLIYELEKEGLPLVRVSARKVYIRQSDLAAFIAKKSSEQKE